MGILANVKYNEDFNHAEGRVDLITRFTTKTLAQFATADASAMAHHNITRDDLYRRVSFIDDIPVSPRLANFCNEVRAANPRIKFGIRRNCTHQMFASGSGQGYCTAYHEVWAYLPEQPYALMRLGYKDYTTSSTSSGESAYGVYSRLVQNRKYNARNEQHCMLMSNDLARAIKNARAVMRPYAPQEVVRVKLHDFVSGVQSETSGINSEVSNAASNVRGDSNLMKELVHLCQSGYAFVSTDLKDKIETYIRARIQRDEHVSKVRHGWFVTVLTRQDTQHFDVIEMFDVHKHQPVLHDPQTYTAETLPEEIAGKMAVLTMVDVGNRVADVGMRATETTFYVERV
jgi:hypothetical protein